MAYSLRRVARQAIGALLVSGLCLGAVSQAGAVTWSMTPLMTAVGSTMTLTIDMQGRSGATLYSTGAISGPVEFMFSPRIDGQTVGMSSGVNTIVFTRTGHGSGTVQFDVEGGGATVMSPVYTVTEGSPPPSITVSASPSSGDKPLTVTYTAVASGYTSIAWSGGGTGLSQTRTYTDYGTYTETATATGAGGTASASASVTVSYSPPAPPDYSSSWSAGLVYLSGVLAAFLVIVCVAWGMWWGWRLFRSRVRILTR